MKNNLMIKVQQSQTYEKSSSKRQIQMTLLNRTQSKNFAKAMESVMKGALKKESSRPLLKKQQHANQQSRAFEHSIIKTQINDEEHKDLFKGQEDEPQNSKKKELPKEEVKKIPYKFSLKSYFIEILVAYGVTFAILYFIKLANFPYFQLIFILGLAVSIRPFRASTGIMICALIITIVNYFLNLQVLTYPSIAICYFSCMLFNQKYKKKIIFIFVFIFMLIYGFMVLPAIYTSLSNMNSAVVYFYIFPILMWLLRTVLNYTYWYISHSALIFLEIGLFITGLQYGTILSRSTTEIEFWYLIVFFTLQIINERTQFTLRVLINLTKSCMIRVQRKQEEKDEEQKQMPPILPAHASGYSCIHSYHLIALVYIYTQLNLYTSPYTPTYSIAFYVSEWYKPLIVWALTSIYQIMSMILQKKRKDKLLYGFTSNKWWRSIWRGLILSLGLWMFYLGLGVGNLLQNRV